MQGCRDHSAHPMGLFPGGLGHGGFILLPLVPNKHFSLLIFEYKIFIIESVNRLIHSPHHKVLF